MLQIRKPIACIALVSLVVTSVLWLGSNEAHACSCAAVDPIDAVGSAEVVFTGIATANRGNQFEPVWEFAVNGVIKGDVTSQETVIGEDWGAGCGSDFGQFRQAVVVYADRVGDQLRARGCMPSPTVQQFTNLLNEVQEPSGTGPPAALISGVYQASDFAIVDDQGRTLARASLGTGNGAVAHCPGTTTAAVVTSFPNPLLTLVDIATLTVIEQQPFDHRFLSVAGDRIMCIDGGKTVVVSAGYGPNDGGVHVASLTTIAGVTTTQDETFRVGRAIPHRGGTVFLLPTRVGDPMETLAADSLKRLLGSAVTLPAPASIIDGDVSPDGSRLAMLATMTGDDAAYDTGATHVLVLTIVDDVPVGETVSIIALANPGAHIETPQGAAKWIRWIDDSTWVIESETVSAKRIRIVADDGTLLVDNVELDWGWGSAPLSTGFLRTTNGGLQVVNRSGATESGDPAPSEDFSDRLLWPAPLVDAPEFTLVAAAAAELSIRPLTAPDTDAGDQPTDGDLPDAADQPNVGTTSPSSSDGLGWLVPVIGGLAFLAAAALWVRSAPSRRN